MRRSASLTLFLSMLSVMSGYLMSHAAWIGRVGISLFHSEYNFLKTWWKGAIAVFIVLMCLYAVQSLIQRQAKQTIARIVHIFAIAIAIVGLYLTYDDFRHTVSHRWLGERFHIGAYLFWIGWITISIYLLMTKQNLKALNNKVGADI